MHLERVVGVDGQCTLVDGASRPKRGTCFPFDGKEIDVANHGVDPDIEVACSRGNFFAAHNKQRGRANAEAFDALACCHAAEPPDLPEPKVQLPGGDALLLSVRPRRYRGGQPMGGRAAARTEECDRHDR